MSQLPTNSLGQLVLKFNGSAWPLAQACARHLHSQRFSSMTMFMFPLHIDSRPIGDRTVIQCCIYIIMYNVSLHARSISTACHSHCSLCVWCRLLDLVVYMRLGLRDTVGGGALPLSFDCS